MPEQAEWEDGCTAGVWRPLTPPAHIDGDDYTHAHQTPVDCRTSAEKTEQRFADLETAMLLLTDEVRHLREDLARITRGESAL